MPDLPKVARLSEAEIKQGKKAGKFIDDYIAFAMKDAPMSPPLFHQTYALAILSTAIARRVFVSVGTNAIYPNLYIMLSAPSTLYTKTTGYKSAMKLLETAGLSHLLLPDGVTPQSLITELSNRPQVRKIIFRAGRKMTRTSGNKNGYSLGNVPGGLTKPPDC
jgi:hypothetical protein